jgi:hypothetical protein
MSDTPSTPEGAFSSEGRKAKGDPGPPTAEPVPAVASIQKPRSPSFLQRQGTTVLVAGIVAAVVACAISIVVQIVLTVSGGGGARLIQEGKVMVPLNADREVFYPIPFASPPNLVLEGNADWNIVKLKAQKADHFIIRQDAVPFGRTPEVRWRAEGIRAGR